MFAQLSYRKWLVLISSVVLLAVAEIGQGIVQFNFTIIPPNATLAQAILTGAVFINVATTIGSLTLASFLSLQPYIRKTTQKDSRWLKVPGSNKAWLFVASSGTMAALATFLWVYIVQEYDVSLIAALDVGTILFVASFEALTGRLHLHKMLKPIILTTAGIILVALTPAKGEVALGAVFLMIFVKGFFQAGDELSKQYAAKEMSAVNLTLWRFIFLDIAGLIVALFVGGLTGELGYYLYALTHIPVEGHLFVLITMVILLTGQSMNNYARSHISATVVYLVSQTRVLLVILLSIGIAQFNSIVLGSNIPTEPILVAIRVIGAAVIILGVYLLNQRMKAD